MCWCSICVFAYHGCSDLFQRPTNGSMVNCLSRWFGPCGESLNENPVIGGDHLISYLFSEPLLLWPQHKPATSRPQRTFLASSCLDLAKPVGFRLSREAIMKQWHAEFVLVSEGCWSALQKFPSKCLISRSQAKHRHPQKQYLEITFRWTAMITGNPPGCHGKTLSHHHPHPLQRGASPGFCWFMTPEKV